LSLTDKNSSNGNIMSILYDGPEDHIAETSNEVRRINLEAIPFLLNLELGTTMPELSTDINLEGVQIEVSIEVVNGNVTDYRFACYLFKDGSVIEKKFYQPDQGFVFQSSGPGNYMCRCFARDKQQGTTSCYSKIVNVAD
jgi:hypothetical protein